jgi:hypothetical protein
LVIFEVIERHFFLFPSTIQNHQSSFINDAVSRNTYSIQIVSSHSAHSLNPQRICVLEFCGECFIWEALPSDGTAEAEDGHGADGGAAAIRGGGKRTAVDHAGADFDAGGEAVENQPTRAALEGVDEAGVAGKLGGGGVEAGGELALEAGKSRLDFRD